MDVGEGYSLTDYINQNNTRFVATVLDFNTGCWVLVLDKDTIRANGQPAALSPIADVMQYLLRTRRDPAHSPLDFLRLLARWEARRRSDLSH